MRTSRVWRLVLGVVAAAGMAHAQPSSQTVVYQGELYHAGAPYVGLLDLRVQLFDLLTGGTALTSAVEIPGVMVEGGRFEVPLPFAASVYTSNPSLWLAIEIKGEGSGAYVLQSPRQPITSAPVARRALSVAHAQTAATATHATNADIAATVTSAVSAQNANYGHQADEATTADQATRANLTGFMAITGNPWARVSGGIRTNNQVGINKAPVSSLDVQGTARLNDGKLYLRSGTFVESQLGWFSPSAPFSTWAMDGPGLIGWAGGILGSVQGGARAVLTWNSAGQVGIATSNTQGFALAVDGTAANSFGGLWAILSDPATKSGIAPLHDAMRRLMQLHGYEFEYEQQHVESGWALPGRQRGLMADEVERVFPDWVERGTDGLRRVTERSTTALLVESLRELNAEQEREFDLLSARIKQLEAQLDAK